MIDSYLTQLGCNDKEKKIYMMLIKIGAQPASVIAKKCHFDRITTYKNAKRLVEKGLIKIYYHNSIQFFGIESFEHLKTAAQEKEEKFHQLVDDFPTIKNLLRSMKSEEGLIPQLEIFEDEAGIKRLFRDLLFEVKENGLHQIRMLTSNTFEEQIGNVKLSKFINEFFAEIRKQRLDLEIYEASGNLIAERLHRVNSKDFNPEKIPAARGTTNIFLAGNTLYIACYQDSQIGLKIKQTQVAQIFHFLFNFIGKHVEVE